MNLEKLSDKIRMRAEESRSPEDVLAVAEELQNEVARITEGVDPADPAVAELRAKTAAIVHNIKMAQAVDAEQRAADDAPIARQKAAAVYAWEKLPVYEWNNRFARVVGRLLSQIPKRHLIHVHNLAAQAHVMSMCITLTHPDLPPEEIPSVEQRRAYATIGGQASRVAVEVLRMLSVKAGSVRIDALYGIDLAGRIGQQFRADVEELAERLPASGVLH